MERVLSWGVVLERRVPVGSFVAGPEQAVHEPGQGDQAVVAPRRVVVAEGPLAGEEVGRVAHGLEGVSLVPLVEGVEVDEEEAAPRVAQGGVGLDLDRRLERVADPIAGGVRRFLALLGLRPVDDVAEAAVGRGT